MKLKSITYYIIVILIAAGVILLSKEFGAPGQRSVKDNSTTLEDHITIINGQTLPQAVLQSRQQEKGGVRVTDPLGNVIWVSTDSATSTKFVISGKPELEGIDSIEDGITALQNRIPDLARAYELEYPDNLSGSFIINVTNHAEVSSLLYEISLELFKIQSTTKWVIDLTGEAGSYVPPIVNEVSDEVSD